MSEEAPKTSNLTMRLLTAVVMVPILLGLLFWAPPWGFVALVYIATAIAATELYGMTMPKARGLQAYGVVSCCALLTALLYGGEQPYVLPGSVVLIAIVGQLVGLFSPAPIERASERTGWLIAGPLYVGGLIGTVALLHLRPQQGSWVVLAMTLAWFGDTGGYFAGRAFGKHKLYELVSPKKTIEGSIGGLAGSVVGALLAHFWYLPQLPLVDGIVLAIIAGALGQVGDLCESLIKRSTGVKDSGWIVPGHGGILDRIDALMFTSSATFVYATFILDRR